MQSLTFLDEENFRKCLVGDRKCVSKGGEEELAQAIQRLCTVARITQGQAIACLIVAKYLILISVPHEK